MAKHSIEKGESRSLYLPTNGVGESPNCECTYCERMNQLIQCFQQQLLFLEEKLSENQSQSPERDYYTVAEFAALVGKSIYTVREWCRLYRINAEKCDTGHGDSKAWKIPAAEVDRYRNHGLLPVPSRY